MSEASNLFRKKLLAFAAVVELVTGLALMFAPGFVVVLLLGPGVDAGEMPLARFAGIALLSLSLACWQGGPRANTGAAVFVGMLTYNVLVALFLAYLKLIAHLGGVMLWPAVALHAIVALLLILTLRQPGRTPG